MSIQESPESASPTITRAVASWLAQQPYQPIELPRWQQAALGALDQVAPQLLPGLVRRVTADSAIDPKLAGRVRLDQLAAARLAPYRGLTGPFQAAVVGSALGGAAAYLSAALGAPFLPEPFILAFKGGSPQDRIEPVLAQASALDSRLRPNHPNAKWIHHFDPVHDGWLTPHVHHVRLKPKTIPAAYQDFLRRRLRPGATLVHLDCQARWLAFPLGPDSRLQVGGWGDIPPHEFIEGSSRLDRWLAERRSEHRGGWRPPAVEPVWVPESEWGAEPAFGQALAAFAAEQGFTYLQVTYPHPHYYSLLAVRLVEALYAHNQEQPAGTFVGMFNLYSPSAVLARRLLPLWLVFNTTDSLAFLRSAIARLPDPLFLAALVTYSRPPDQAPWQAWASALEGRQWFSVGARRHRYPEDTIALWSWLRWLEAAAGPLSPVPLEHLPMPMLLPLVERAGLEAGQLEPVG